MNQLKTEFNKSLEFKDVKGSRSRIAKVMRQCDIHLEAIRNNTPTPPITKSFI